jgi:hypothetical protein
MNELSGLKPGVSDLKQKPPLRSGRQHSSPVLKDRGFLQGFINLDITYPASSLLFFLRNNRIMLKLLDIEIEFAETKIFKLSIIN